MDKFLAAVLPAYVMVGLVFLWPKLRYRSIVEKGDGAVTLLLLQS